MDQFSRRSRFEFKKTDEFSFSSKLGAIVKIRKLF